MISIWFGNIIAVSLVIAGLFFQFSTGLSIAMFIGGLLMWIFLLSTEIEIKTKGITKSRKDKAIKHV